MPPATKIKSHTWKKWTLTVVPWLFKNGKKVSVTALYFSIHCKQRDDYPRTKTKL